MTRPWTQPTLTLLLLLGAAIAISPPSPVAANENGCDSVVDCLIDTVPVPPGPCGGILQIVESCRCLTHVGACGIEVPDPCDDVGDCGCIIPEHVNSPDDVRVCGYTVNPCAWLAGMGSTNACACVNVPTTTTFGRAPSGSGSCGIALPSGPGDGRPDPCDGLPADTCGCITISNTIPGVALSAVPDYVCGIPTNPCALVSTGTLADGCGCVEMNGPQRLSLAGLFAATSVTSTGIIPTSICGFPTDPCATSAGAVACECVAQIEREVLQGGGGGETPAILAFQRIVTPPAFCVTIDRLPVPCAAIIPGDVCCLNTNGDVVLFETKMQMGGPNYRVWVLVEKAPKGPPHNGSQPSGGWGNKDMRVGWDNQLPQSSRAISLEEATSNGPLPFLNLHNVVSMVATSGPCGIEETLFNTHGGPTNPALVHARGSVSGITWSKTEASSSDYTTTTTAQTVSTNMWTWNLEAQVSVSPAPGSVTAGGQWEYGTTTTYSQVRSQNFSWGNSVTYTPTEWIFHSGTMAVA